MAIIEKVKTYSHIEDNNLEGLSPKSKSQA